MLTEPTPHDESLLALAIGRLPLRAGSYQLRSTLYLLIVAGMALGQATLSGYCDAGLVEANDVRSARQLP